MFGEPSHGKLMSPIPLPDEASRPSDDPAPVATAERTGVSGQGAGSALVRLRELEQQRQPTADQPIADRRLL
jgi:hypothetical protein